MDVGPFLLVILPCFILSTVAGIAAQVALTRFQRAYRAVYPEAPPFPGGGSGQERPGLRAQLTWRRILAQPIDDARLEQLRQEARRRSRLVTLAIYGGFVATLGVDAAIGRIINLLKSR